jgi:toxin-antitoxin system PIN domain toxin
LSESAPVLLSWWTVLAFLRLATHPRIFPQPYSPAEATAIVSSWLERPMVALAIPGPAYWDRARQVITEANARGNLLNDALLAALALENGAPLATTDVDFRRFSGLSIVDPLSRPEARG